jgi:GNAT superfamily N-acetyltransferase
LPELTNAFRVERSDIVSDETKDTGKVDEPQLAADEVKEEELEWFRHADNATWWSGAVLAHGKADGLAERIGAAERFYAKRNAVTRFQVCADCPVTLDPALAERGYRREAMVSLFTAVAGTLVDAPRTPGTMVRVDTTLSRDWLAVLSATSQPGVAEDETGLFSQVDPPHAYLTVFAGGEPVGIGRAVAERGWTGVFNMATVPGMRRRGIAHIVLSAIAGWADAHDAPQLFLQVEQSNEAGRRLYQAVGFSRLARYHYRVRAEE